MGNDEKNHSKCYFTAQKKLNRKNSSKNVPIKLYEGLKILNLKVLKKHQFICFTKKNNEKLHKNNSKNGGKSKSFKKKT